MKKKRSDFTTGFIENKIKFLFLFLFLSIVAIEPVYCTDSGVNPNLDKVERISELSDRILHRIIDIERFYINYWMFANKEPRFRRMRYFAFQEAGAAGELAQSTVCLGEISRNLAAPSKVNSEILTRGYVAGMIGTILAGSGSGIELFSNTYTAIKNKIKGKNPGRAKKIFIASLKEIDILLAERKKLEDQLTSSVAHRLHKSEGELLKYFRDWCVYEFVDIYADVKSYQASNSVYYFFDTTANIISTVSYGQFIRGAKYTHLNGPGGINGIIGDGLFIAEAPVSSLAGKLLYKRYFKQITRELNEKPYDPRKFARKARETFHNQIAVASPAEIEDMGPIKKRLNAYSLWNTRYEEYVVEHSSQLRHLSKVARQDNISGPAISTASLGQCVLGTISTYRFSNHPHISQNLNFAGSISGEVGNSANILLTTQSLIAQKLYEKKLAKKGALPKQLLDNRLNALNEMETIIYPDKKLPDNPPVD